MTDLIKVNYENERPTVSGRELHEALGINTKYADWFPRMCEYGFTEGEDYCSILRNRSDGLPGKPLTDHLITIPMAKELCMLQRNEKGKEFRQYFIKVEEAWNSPEMVMKRALEFANKRVEELKQRTFCLESKIEQDKPKVLFADAVETADTSILIGDLAKLIRQNGVDIGQNRLFEWMRQEGYLLARGSARNMPSQHSMDMGLFEVKERTMQNPDGSIRIVRTTKVTGRGQTYFVNKFLSEVKN